MAVFDERLDKAIRDQIIKQVLDEWVRENATRVTSQIYQQIFDKLSTNIDFGSMRQRIMGQRFRFTRLISQINNQINQAVQATINESQGVFGTETRIPTKEDTDKLKQINKRQIELLEDAIKTVQKRNQLKQMLPGGADTYSRVSKFATAQGFDPNWDLKSATYHAPLGVTDILYSKNVDGVMQKMRVTVNKFGEVLVHTQRRLQDFFTAVGKDVIEFAKWSLAVALVLGPISKLNDLIKQSIENQTKLTNVLIALGNVQKSVNQIFQASYDIAKANGEAIGGVIDAYTMAYRATGGTVAETERFTVAGKLLSDSLILSKLSTLNQSEAIDTLTAALKQSEGELSNFGNTTDSVLTKGSVLLDKWVRTTKVANVSLDALATSFSIVGDAAEAAGLGIDELNGVVAVLGEVTGDVSGKEIGNMARALVSGFQSDRAAKQLQQLGIAIQDTTGQARGFLDVYGEIAQLRQGGLISDEQLNKITLAIGGGTRRQAIVQAFIEQFGRIKQVSKESMNASGDSAQALAKQLETVSTATTRLANAFNALAQSLGTKGGILDIFTRLLNFSTSIVEAITKLTGLLGRTTPMLAATLGVAAYAGIGSRLRGEKLVLGLSTTAERLVGWLIQNSSIIQSLNPRIGIGTGGVPAYQGAVNTRNWVQSNWRGIASGAIIGMNVLGNLSDQEATTKEKSYRVGANIAGGIAGAIVGGPLGAAIGASLAEAFFNGTILNRGSWEDFFKEVWPEKPTEESPTETRRTYFESQLYKAYGDWLGKQSTIGTGEDYGVMWANILSFLANASQKVRGFVQPNYPVGQITPRQLALGTMLPRSPELAKMYDKLIKEQKFEETGITEEFAKKMAEIMIPSGLIQKYQEQLRSELIKRTITPTSYTTKADILSGFSTLGKKYYAGFGQQYGQLTGKTQNQILEDFIKMTTYASSEELDFLTSLNGEIATLYEQLEAVKDGTIGYNQVLGDYIQKTGLAAEITKQLVEAQLATKELPEIIDMTKYSDAIIKQILNLAQKIQFEEYQAAGFTHEEYQAKIALAPKTIMQTPTGYAEITGLIEAANYIGKAVEIGSEKGIITGLQSIEFQGMDYTRTQYEAATKAYYPLLKALEALGYKEQRGEEILIFKDGFSVEKRDMKIVQYLLSQILDVNEKQLAVQGYYNFPEGMTPYIPYSAIKDYENLARNGIGQSSIINDLIKQYEDLQTENRKRIDRQKPEEFPYRIPATFSMYGGNPPAYTNQVATQTVTSTMDYIKDILSRSFSMYGGKPPTYTQPTIPTNQFTPFQPQQPFQPQYYPPGITPITPSITPNLVDTLKTSLANLSTKLAININDRITVTLDGRVIATIIKSYLKQDLVKYGNSNTATRAYVV